MTYRIAEAAEHAALPASTIRYYETQGVLPEPARDPSGSRTYDADDLGRLRFVGQARHRSRASPSLPR